MVKRDAASLVGTDVDDDIDVVDVIDPDLFPIFEEEAAELLPQLGGALRQWAARPTIWVPAAKSCVPCTPQRQLAVGGRHAPG